MNKDEDNILKDIVDDLSKTVKDSAEEILDSAKEKAEKVITEVKKDIDSFESKYFKILAEMENLRKRMNQEKVDMYKFKAASLIQEILPTLDMFEMALNTKNVSDELKNWLMGFEMILRNLKNALETEGVKEINTKPGDEFKGEFHHAIDEVDSNEIPEGKIVEVKSKGYLIHNRLLRAASVIVAKKKQTNKEEKKHE